MKHALRYARRVNGLIKVPAENAVLMWKREPFGQMHIARWGQTCGDYQTRKFALLERIRLFMSYRCGNRGVYRIVWDQRCLHGMVQI